MKKHFLQKTLALAALSSGLILTACNSGNDTPDASNTPEQSPAVTASAAPEESVAPDTPTPTPEPEEPVYELKEKTTLKDWEITVSKAKFVKSVKQSEYSEFVPDEGNKYLMISVSVTNNGKEEDSFLPSYIFNDDVYAKVYYGDGYEFSMTNLLAYDESLVDKKIQPLSKKKGKIAFEVPDSVAEGEEELVLKIISGEDSITYKLK